MVSDTPQIDDIYLTALDKPEGAPRDAYLDEACGGDTELQQRVQRLLSAQPNLGSFLESPAPGIDTSPTIDQPFTERPGDSIGPYKLLQQIGEGGMGIVFLAEQTEPVARRVALKVIKPGMDTRQVIRRFEAERHALELMDHPNIAKVLDAGTTETGRPYFVMELVHGVPITQYCDEHQLVPRERLELFVPLCQAVQHAHQKGIIHRDIKPSNVLVALYDNLAVPKIIDFGVAKATAQRITEKTLFTEYGQVVGTPEYMSPEQAQLNHLDIDTRTDVYSLGVLLYELLTGDTPFDRQRLRSAAFDELLQIIREEEPPRPSTKLSASESLPTIAANRHVEPKQLTTMVRGELDWIVMKALEKDRQRRYVTASKFAEDVEHYLHDEAVSACPPSRVYRFRKFARRNKAAIAIVTTLAITLLAGVLGTTNGWIRASQAEGQARRIALSEAQALTEAVRQRQRAKTSLARMQLEHGIDQLEGEDTRGLLNLIEAWKTADENPELRAAIGRLWAIAQEGAEGHLVHVFPTDNWAVAFSPDGKLLATANGREAQLWDLITGEAASQPLVHDQPVNQILFSRHGKRLATVSSNGTARLWDAATQHPVGPPLRHPTLRRFDQWTTQPAAFSPDGKFLATGVEGGVVCLWDAISGNPIGNPLRPKHSLSAMAIGPRGHWLAIGSEDGMVQLWDTATCEPHGEPLFQPLPGDVVCSTNGVVFSPDGQLLAASYSTNAAAVWNIETGELHSVPALQEMPDRGWIQDITFSTDGTRLATGSSDWTAALWDIDTGELIGLPMQHNGRVRSVAFSVDGELLATASLDGTLRLWDGHSGLPHGAPRQQGNPVERVLFSPDKRLMASGGWRDTRVWRVDQITKLSHVAKLRTAAQSSDGRFRATITPQSTVEVVNATSPATAVELSRDDGFRAVAFSPDSRLVAAGSNGFFVHIWEVATGQSTQKLSCPERVYAVAFSPDGKTLAAGLRDGTILLWDYATGNRLGLPMRHQAYVLRVAFSPDGKVLASLSGYMGQPSKLWFWDLTTGPDYVGVRVPHLKLAPDEQLETFNLDGSLKLLDANRKERIWTLPEAPENVHEMQLATWVALGLEQNLKGRVKNISAAKWRSLREELNAYASDAKTTDERMAKPDKAAEDSQEETTDQKWMDE